MQVEKNLADPGKNKSRREAVARERGKGQQVTVHWLREYLLPAYGDYFKKRMSVLV